MHAMRSVVLTVQPGAGLHDLPTADGAHVPGHLLQCVQTATPVCAQSHAIFLLLSCNPVGFIVRLLLVTNNALP